MRMFECKKPSTLGQQGGGGLRFRRRACAGTAFYHFFFEGAAEAGLVCFTIVDLGAACLGMSGILPSKVKAEAGGASSGL